MDSQTDPTNFQHVGLNNSTSSLAKPLGTKIELNSEIGGFLVLYAFRYAIGRRTYAAQETSNFIRSHFSQFTIVIQKLIVREIEAEIERNQRCADSEHLPSIDMSCWISTLALITAPRSESDQPFDQLELPLILE